MSMGLSVSLEAQKQSIETSVAMQTAMKKRNPNLAANADFTDTYVSIFGAQIRAAIRDQAAKANDTSSQIVLKNRNNQGEVASSLTGVNQNVADLQSLISWAGAATQEIANIPGMSSSALTAVQQTMNDTMQFASAAINNSITRANEALSQIKNTQTNKVQNKQTSEIVNKTQSNLESISQNTAQVVENTQPEIIINNQAATPIAQGETAPAAETKTAPALEAKAAPAVETKAAPVAETKTAETPKVEAPKVETAKVDINTEPVKLNIKA